MRWLRDYQDRVMKDKGKRPVRPGRLLLQWHVTDRCNLRCSHCYQETYSGPELKFGELLEVVEQYRQLLAARAIRRGHINVTGGEPFMREDFIPFLEALSAHRDTFSFAILCNGSFLDKATAVRLRVLKPAFVQVSMEGGKTTHDRIRGKGDFERVLRGVDCLRKEKLRAYISFTAHKDNYREFKEVADAGTKLGVARVWADRLIPAGGGAAMADKALSPEETKEFFEILQKAREKAERSWLGHTEIAMGRALQFIVGGGEPYRCGAGGTLLALGADGTLYPCRRMAVPIGNVMSAPLARLYGESDFLVSLRERDRISPLTRACTRAATTRKSPAMTTKESRAKGHCLRSIVYDVTERWRRRYAKLRLD